jgi:xanthine dehydrogenase YagR molybdenum-binding subunit
MSEDKHMKAMEGASALYTKTATDMRQEIPPAVEETEQQEFKIIGRHTSRIDGKRIVTGKAPYTHDIKLRGMLHGKILRSPHPKAEVISIDLSQAKSLPGVKAAIELGVKKVNYIGDRVAAVAAIDEQTAEKALKLIKVEYNALPYAVTEERAKEDGAPQVHEKRKNIHKFNDQKRGDVEAGLMEADVTLEHTYKTPVEIHHPAETHASIAIWKGDRLTVWDSTQGVHSVRDGLAQALNVPMSKVRVIKHYMGGGFGSKLFVSEHTIAAALLAKEAKKPVKIVLTRKENALCVGNRPSSLQTYKGGVKRDGTLTALSLVNYTSGGIEQGDRCAEPIWDVYKCANVSAKEYSVYTNTGAQRPARAPGHVQGTFGLEGFLDELANQIDMDPLELRRKNYSLKNQGDTGIPYSSKGLDQCYDMGAEKIGWDRRNKRPGEGTGLLRRGLGMASQIWWGGGVPGTLADVRIYPDGSVDVISGTQDIGCGTRTFMAMITAETLGLKPQDISVKIGDTDYPWAILSGGSLTVPSVAPAVRRAALKAAERMKELAAGILKVPADELILADKKITSKNNPEKTIEFIKVARNLRRETVFHGERQGLPQGYAYNTFSAHFVEVEVNVDTGQIKALKVIAAHESGQIMNKQTAESQIIGGITQGISTALFEQRVLDETPGTLVNPNWRDYKIATAMDMPEITPLFVDMVDPRINILGTKGLGEPPRIPIAAALGNAVYNAIGVHVREIPMTPDKVLQALKRKEVG